MKLLRELPLRTVPVVEPSTSVNECNELLAGEPLGLVVLVGDGQYMGIYRTEDRDSGRIPVGADLEELAVGPYAGGHSFTASPTTSVDDAYALMVRQGLSVLPVVANRIYKGVLTAEDLVQAQ